MAFPTIPTVAATRLLTGVQANTTATRTFPSLTGLTKSSGDLLIAICVAYQTTATANAAFSGWTAGWTEFKDQSSATTMAIGMAYKWSTGSETGTISVTQAATITGQAAMILMSIPGAHATTPPEAGSIANGTSAAANPAAFDPAGWAAEDTLWIAVAGDGETATTGSFTAPTAAPTNYTNFAATAISQDVVGGVAGAVAFRQLNAASEDVGAFAVDTSNARNSAIVIAVRPAPVVITAINTLVDNFDSLDATKWTPSDASKVASTGGYLDITPGADPNYTKYTANVNYTLVGSAAWVNVVQVATGDSSVDTAFTIQKDASNLIGFQVESGTLYAQTYIAAVNNLLNLGAFGPSSAWWKVSESGGSVQWWVSGDGIDWGTAVRTETVASLFDVSAVKPLLQAGWWSGAPLTPGHALFDWFNVQMPVTATSTAVARISLAGLSIPFTRALHSIRVRARRTALGSAQMKAAIYEGATNRSGDLTSAFLSTSLAEYGIAIPSASAADITDYSDLELRIWGYSGAGSTIDIEISDVWLDAPSAADFPAINQTVPRWSWR